VHGLTDITGFGLAGHALEMARGAKAAIRIAMDRVPLLPGVRELAGQGMVTGASGRNWAAYGDQVKLGSGLQPVDQALLSDPQTSGGLLVACAPEAVAEVLAVFQRHGFAAAAEVGEIVADAGDGVRLLVG
jgi:selenide,water dikinase